MAIGNTSSSFHALARLLRYARGYRRRILAAASCSVINKLFDIAPEILIGIAIDVVVNQESSFVARMGFDSPQQQIFLLAVLTFLIWVGESVFQYLYMVLWRNLAQRLQADLRQALDPHLASGVDEDRHGVGADGHEGDVAEVQQAGETEVDVEPDGGHGKGRSLDAERLGQAVGEDVDDPTHQPNRSLTPRIP